MQARALGILLFLAGCGGQATRPPVEPNWDTAPPSTTQPIIVENDPLPPSSAEPELEMVDDFDYRMGEVPCEGATTPAEARACISQTQSLLASSTINAPVCIGVLCPFAESARIARATIDAASRQGLGPGPMLDAAEADAAAMERTFETLRDHEIMVLGDLDNMLALAGRGRGAVERARKAALEQRMRIPGAPISLATSDVPERLRSAAVSLVLAELRVDQLLLTLGERHPHVIAAKERVHARRADFQLALSQSLTELAAR